MSTACVVVSCLAATACGDDFAPSPIDITSTTGEETTAGPTTVDPSTSSSTTEPPTSSTTSDGSSSSSTSDTGDTSVDVGEPSGVPNFSWVNAGHSASNDNFRVVFTLGQLAPAQNTQTSPQYRLQGGVIGANGTRP